MKKIKMVFTYARHAMLGVLFWGSFVVYGATASHYLNFIDKNASIEQQVELLMEKMTLAEKIGQMTQADKESIDRAVGDIKTLALGSLLSGGGQLPEWNTPEGWVEMVNDYQTVALSSRLKIPLLYGVDAVHGHSNVIGTTIFPHNIGLGATRDEDLVRRIGQITGFEVFASGVHWNFAPAIPVAQDIRWGRLYESFSEDVELVCKLGAAYTLGQQQIHPYRGKMQTLGTAKHFVGDGGATWMTSPTDDFKIDRGDLQVDEKTLRSIHLKPYYDQVAHGVQTVMASYSSWNGVPMHVQKYLLTDVLKGEMGFDGFIVSDWLAVSFLKEGTYDEKVVRSINAGIDMVMAVGRYREFMASLTRAVEAGKVSMARIDDAVRRILRVKFRYGLFQTPYASKEFLTQVRTEASRQVAEEAVEKSAVLLKNEANALPLNGQDERILILGEGADDIGLQSGGWTVKWQGHRGNIIPGTTVLDGLRDVASPGWRIDYLTKLEANCRVVQPNRMDEECDLLSAAEVPYTKALVVIAEEPYAEGYGDDGELVFDTHYLNMIDFARQHAQQVIVLMYSGRPMIIGSFIDKVDALIAAWLPGTEAQGLVNLLTGVKNFTGKLPFSWPKSMVGFQGVPVDQENVLYPFGYGLRYMTEDMAKQD
ncbi:MAG: glycoside hydrolase family 3 protein [Zetaproteobacteria bacterium]|nr:glycoside hydrolase family 3 protein [Zetaproteobacteria bacterium]